MERPWRDFWADMEKDGDKKREIEGVRGKIKIDKDKLNKKKLRIKIYSNNNLIMKK